MWTANSAHVNWNWKQFKCQKVHQVCLHINHNSRVIVFFISNRKRIIMHSLFYYLRLSLWRIFLSVHEAGCRRAGANLGCRLFVWVPAAVQWWYCTAALLLPWIVEHWVYGMGSVSHWSQIIWFFKWNTSETMGVVFISNDTVWLCVFIGCIFHNNADMAEYWLFLALELQNVIIYICWTFFLRNALKTVLDWMLDASYLVLHVTWPCLIMC